MIYCIYSIIITYCLCQIDYKQLMVDIHNWYINREGNDFNPEHIKDIFKDR